jgi:hypothetical protein
MGEKGTMQCKFTCDGRTPDDENGISHVILRAVHDPEIPEDRRFSDATPSGTLNLMLKNPAFVIEPGKSYYLYIEEV